MVTMQEVLKVLAPDEPRYQEAAGELGLDALPFLREVAASSDALTASKAVSLAAFIGGAAAGEILEVAAKHAAVGPRAAAAYGARYLHPLDGERVALVLMEDAEEAVAKFAVRSAAELATSALEERLHALVHLTGRPVVAKEARDAVRRLAEMVR